MDILNKVRSDIAVKVIKQAKSTVTLCLVSPLDAAKSDSAGKVSGREATSDFGSKRAKTMPSKVPTKFVKK